MSCLRRTYLALGVQLRREIYMYTIYLLCPIFLTDHSRFVQSRNEKCKLEVWSISLLTSSLAFTPSYICLRPIRSSFRSLNRNSWQFAQFSVTREAIQKPIDKFAIYKFLFVRRHVYKPNEQSQQDRRTRIHVSRLLGSYCRLQVLVQHDWPFDNTASGGLMGWLHWQGSFRPFRVYFGRLGFCYCRGNYCRYNLKMKTGPVHTS